MTTNISNIPRTGYSVGNPLNGADAVAQDSGNILSGVCLQLNHHIVRSNYLSYNPTRNGTQPLNHLWYSFGFHIDQDIRIHRHWGTPSSNITALCIFFNTTIFILVASS